MLLRAWHSKINLKYCGPLKLSTPSSEDFHRNPNSVCSVVPPPIQQDGRKSVQKVESASLNQPANKFFFFLAGESKNQDTCHFHGLFSSNIKSRIYQEGSNHQEKKRELCTAFCSETPGTGLSAIAYFLSMWNGTKGTELIYLKF